MRLFKSKEKLSESESVYLADIEQKIKAYKAKGYQGGLAALCANYGVDVE